MTEQNGEFAHVLILEKLEAGAKQFVATEDPDLKNLKDLFNPTSKRVIFDNLDVLERMKKSPEHAKEIAVKLHKISQLPNLTPKLAGHIIATALAVA